MLACPRWRERSRAIFGRLAALVELALHKALGYRHIRRVFMARLNSRRVSSACRILWRVSDTYMINTFINT